MILNNTIPINIQFKSKRRIMDISRCPTNFSYEYISRVINTSINEKCYHCDWFRRYGKYYYFKNMFPIRELLMAELFSMYGIECVDYTLAKNSEFTGVMSMNFRTFRNNYDRIDAFLLKRTGCETPENNTTISLLDKLLRDSTDDKSRIAIMRDLTKMLALDFVTGQADRYARNIIIEGPKNSQEAHLAPLTDNGVCFRDYCIDINENYIQDLNFKAPTNKDTLALIQENELFRSTLYSLLDVEFGDIIKRTETKHGISIDEDAWESMIELFDRKKDIVESALKLVRK